MDHHDVINALLFTNPAPAPAPVFASKTQGGHEFGPLTKNLAPLELVRFSICLHMIR